MHIVHIIPTLNFGGAERFVVDLVNHRHPSLRHSLVLFFPVMPLKEELHAQTTITVVQKRGQMSIHLFTDLKRILRDLRPDIVHTHLFGGDFWGRVAAHRLGIPIVTTEHNVNMDEGYLKTGIKRWLRHYSTVYTCPSQAVADFMYSAYHVNKKSVQIIRHGIDLSRFTHLPPAFSQEQIRFLLLGRLAPQKGHTIAILALSLLKNFSWIVDIVGGGPLREHLNVLVKEKKLHDRVRFLPPTPNTPTIFTKADVLLMPSLWEGLGITAMEAMACGRLVIGSRVGGIPEIIHDGVTGLLAPPGIIEEWVQQIRWCFMHREGARTIAKLGQEHARKEFGIQDMVQAYERLYANLTST